MHKEVEAATLNPYEMAVQQFEAAAEKLNLSEDMREILRQPKRELCPKICGKFCDSPNANSQLIFPCVSILARSKCLPGIVYSTM